MTDRPLLRGCVLMALVLAVMLLTTKEQFGSLWPLAALTFVVTLLRGWFLVIVNL